MAAYDNVNLASPPNIATAGNFADQLYKMLSNAPDAYYKGQENQYQQRQRNLFANGTPTNAAGQPDFAGMLQKIIQSGGAPAAEKVLPMLQKQPFLDAALKEYQSESGGQPQNTGPATSSAASGPANITGGYGNGQPRVAADTNGADTVNSLAAERGVDLDAFLAKFPGVRQLLNRDLTPSQSQAISQRMSAFKGGGDQPMGSASTGGISGGPQANPVPQAGLSGGDENNTNQQTPVGVGGSSAISPAPTSASGNIGGTPPASFSDRFQGQTQRQAQLGGAANMVPAGADPLSYAMALKKRAEEIRRQANTQGIIGIPTKAKEDQAAAKDKQADAILEQLGKTGELTPEMKNAGTAGMTPLQYERAKPQSAEAGKAAGKRIGEAIEAGGAPARQTINTLDVMEDALRRSGSQITTGWGGEQALAFKRAVNNIIPGFFDARAIVDAEAIQKLNAKLAADAAKAMTQRPSQLEFRAFMQNNPGLNTTVQGSLFLIDILRQQQEMNVRLGQEALRADPGDWASREDAFYRRKENQIRNPLTGKPLKGGERGGAVEGAPPVGHVQDGYQFQGGNHRDPKNWRKLGPEDRS